MAVSALRAVVSAHLEGSLNRLRRQLGTLGVWATALFLGMGFLLFVAPFVTGLSFMGFLLGDALSGDGNVERNRGALGLFLSVLTIGGGLFAGIGGASRQLPWESLQAYPVGSRSLFLAELVAGATELLTLVELVALLGVCVGVSVGAPLATPFLLVALVCGALSSLSLQLAAASIAQRLSKQVRVLVVVLPFLAVLMAAGSPAALSAVTSKSPTSALQVALWLGRVSPMGLVLEAGMAPYGLVSWSDVPLRLMPALVLAVVSVIGAYLLVSREKPIELNAGAGVAGKLWTFSSQTWGVARLQWQVLTTSLPGRAMLLMPLLTVVLIRGPLAFFFQRGGWVIPGAFLYAGLSSTNLLFNQFGLDRHGVKVLLLLPVDELALLRGKQWAFAAWQAVQAVLLTVLLVAAGHRDGWALFLGWVLGACSFCVVSTVGQFMSIWQPHPLSKNGMRGTRPPLVVVLVTLMTVFGGGGSLFALGSWLFRTSPRGGSLVMLAVALVLAAVAHAATTFNAGFLRVSKERLVESLGATA